MAKQVRELAKIDTFAAARLAERGKQFSEIEILLNLFYETLQELRKIRDGKKTSLESCMQEGVCGWSKETIARHRAEIPKSVQNFAGQISQILIDAICARNPDKIIEIAEAVKFLKIPREPKDPIRSQILSLKDFLEKQNEQWKIGQLAKIMDWPKYDRENGFPQLRRLCKELEFPLAHSR